MLTDIDNFIDILIYDNNNNILDIINGLETGVEGKLEPYKDTLKENMVIDTSYKGLIEINYDINDIVSMAHVIQNISFSWEVLILQSIIDSHKELNLKDWEDVIILFESITLFEVPLIETKDLYEFAYENGISLDVERENVEQHFVDTVLIPAGYTYVKNNGTLEGWIDTEHIKSFAEVFK